MNHHRNGDQLSVTRINRLFRSLRIKCAALASFEPPFEAATPVRPRQWKADDPAPLFVLAPPKPPGSVRGRGNTDGTYETAQKLYAVRDSFRNVVTSMLGNSTKRENNSLVALCARVVGTMIETEVKDAVEDLETDKFVEDDDIALEITRNLYETVPMHHRRWTVLSHAIQIILDTCSDHVTLLFILLPICREFCLIHESILILRKLLHIATTAPPHLPPLLCHPAHDNFLRDLRAICLEGEPEITSLPLHFILIETLKTSHEAWSCKAVAKYTRDLTRADFQTFARTIQDLGEIMEPPQIAVTSHRRHGITKRDRKMECDHDVGLHLRFANWVVRVADHVLENSPDSQSNNRDLLIALDILNVGHPRNLRRSHSFKCYMPDATLRLAISCLIASVWNSPRQSPEWIDPVMSFIARAEPPDNVYDGVIDSFYSRHPNASPRQWRLSTIHSLEETVQSLTSLGIPSKWIKHLWDAAIDRFDNHPQVTSLRQEAGIFRSRLQRYAEDGWHDLSKQNSKPHRQRPAEIPSSLGHAIKRQRIQMTSLSNNQKCSSTRYASVTPSTISTSSNRTTSEYEDDNMGVPSNKAGARRSVRKRNLIRSELKPRRNTAEKTIEHRKRSQSCFMSSTTSISRISDDQDNEDIMTDGDPSDYVKDFDRPPKLSTSSSKRKKKRKLDSTDRGQTIPERRPCNGEAILERWVRSDAARSQPVLNTDTRMIEDHVINISDTDSYPDESDERIDTLDSRCFSSLLSMAWLANQQLGNRTSLRSSSALKDLSCNY